jgi:hypothetical protein
MILEWSITVETRRSLTVDERKDYIRAVKCLIDAKPKTQIYAKNINNRYEDFVAMHVNTSLAGQ